jgi:hypothetical protein
VPASRDGLGPFYQDVIAVSPLEPWDAASAAYRLEILARTLPLEVAALLRALHAWSVPGDLADLLRYPGEDPDPLWLYALAYTIRQIIFWPPDRAEADDLEITHPLHTLRRLIDAPLPLLAAGLS